MSDKNLIGSHIVRTLFEFEALAGLFASQLQIGDIVCLQGDLGVGKTTFVQYVGRAVGVKDAITSPTYTIVAEYGIQESNQGISRFIHVDAYRESMDTNYVHEIIETARSQHAIVFIEWPEKLGATIPAPRWDITLVMKPNNSSRIITIGRVE